MATCTLAFSRASTANTTAYVGNSFTPSAGDALVVFVSKTGSVNAGTMTDTASQYTWIRVANILYNSNADSLEIFYADNLAPASPSGTTVTYDCTGDGATGCNLGGYRIAGTEGGATLYLRQGKLQAVASSATPKIDWTGTASVGTPNTNNPMVACAVSGTNPPALTAPAGWTESVEIGYGTPAGGMQLCYIDSGEVNSTLSWGNTSASIGACAAVELYASGQGPNPDSSSMGFFGIRNDI